MITQHPNILGEDALAVGMGDRVTVEFEDRKSNVLPQFRCA
ncbi:hypothetical protein [Sinorhizobium meliloti]|nr:hypothetical protein [Sinorhizobium meliloti]